MGSFLHNRPAARSIVLSLSEGFTLIEMVIVIAIIGIITIVVITSQGNFNKTILLANTAYDVALAMRSAESYGIGSQPVGSIANVGYGLDFRSGSGGSFTFFADSDPPLPVSTACHPNAPDSSAPDAKPGDCAYIASRDAWVKTYTLNNGITISDFCATYAGTSHCASAGAITTLDIVFIRPDPNPYMSIGTNGDAQYSSANPVTQACLALTSPQGGKRYVSVSLSGEINANAASCP